jgi:hypothetical protein
MRIHGSTLHFALKWACRADLSKKENMFTLRKKYPQKMRKVRISLHFVNSTCEPAYRAGFSMYKGREAYVGDSKENAH